MESRKRYKKRYNRKKDYVRKDVRSFLRSLAVLLLVIMAVFGTTFAWIEGGKNASTAGENCTVEAGAGLQFIGVNADDISNGVLTLPTNISLQDCTSVDGRNFYIPTTGSIQAATPGVVADTANLKFRSAVDADVNGKSAKIVTKDFIIKSLEGTSSGSSTPIYIGSASQFTCNDSCKSALRLSINFNDGTAPVVLCPALSYANQQRDYKPVSGINNTGAAVPTPTTLKAESIAKYYYGATPLFTLPPGESRRVTVTLWLEGTDEACVESETNKILGQDISMKLYLTTEDSYMRTITFVDYTPSSWVKNAPEGKVATMYVVESNSGASYAMTRTDDITYTASIPRGFTNIYFQRTTESALNTGDTNTFNYWSKDDSDSLDSSATYYAIGRGPGTDDKNPIDDKNYGYWVDSVCQGVIDIYYQDTNYTLASEASSEPYIHLFSDQTALFKPWDGDIPNQGLRMERVGETNVYHFIAPANASFLFNGGKIKADKSIERLQTVDITSAVSDFSIDVTQPGVTNVGYILGGTNTEGKYTVTKYNP